MSDDAVTPEMGRIARIRHWLLANPLLTGVGLLGSAGAIAIILLALSPWLDQEEVEAPTVDRTLALFEVGDYDQAKLMAKALSGSKEEPYAKGVAAYVLGRILVDRECMPERREELRRGLFLIASRYFDEADLQRVPSDLTPEVNYWWGKTLFEANELEAARTPLLAALEKYEPGEREILHYLALIHFKDSKLSKAKGVEYCDLILADLTLAESDRNEILALKTKLLLQDERLDEASEIHKNLPDSPDRSSIFSEVGQARLREAARLEALRQSPEAIRNVYQLAVEAFERDPEVFGESDIGRATKRYRLARAQKGAGDLLSAKDNFGYVRRQFFDQPIGIAAGFWEALCLLELEMFSEAKGQYTSMLTETVRANNQGESEWLNQETISKLVQLGVERYLKLGNYEAAVELAEEFRAASQLRDPPIPLSNAAKLKSMALKQWIGELENQEQQAAYRDREALASILKEKYNDYGHALYSLAINRFASTDYSKDLYEAGEAFFKAEDYRRATLAFKQYLNTNDDSQAAQTRLRVGQSLLAQRDFPAALEALNSVWALYPNDPVVYQARYQAAECYLELANPLKAEEMLRANLDNDALTPSSQEWIESLFLLGDLLFDEGMRLEALSNAQAAQTGTQADPIETLEQAYSYYKRAIRRLNEAVQRQPFQPAAKLGRYHLAEAYRRSNLWHELQLSRTTVNASQIELNKAISDYNEKAILHFDKLEEHLNMIREERPLDPNEDALLRNSFFGRGNLYYQLNRFEDAILMYRAASNMVIQQPEVLEAYVQIASCYRKMNKHDEAGRVINQAKILLRDRIPQNADFEATTRFSRDRWVTLLEWLSTI